MYDFGIKGAAYKHENTLRLFNSSGICDVKDTTLNALRQGFCAFQAMVWSDKDFLLTITESPLFHKAGPLDIIRTEVELKGWSSNSLKVFLVDFIDDDNRKLKADILLTQEFIKVNANTVQPIWIDIQVPEDMPPGLYRGKVKFFRHIMFQDEELAGELYFSVNVRNITLPKPSEYSFYLDLWQHNSNIARKHEVTLWSDEHFEIIERYLKTLSNLGQKAITVIASEIPWSGQNSHRDIDYTSDLFEYNMVRVKKTINGEFKLDFGPMDRYIELCQKYAIDDEIEVFGLVNIWIDEPSGYANSVDYIDDIRIRYFDEATGTYKFMKTQVELEEYIKGLEEHFIERGWIDKVRIVADEPADTELYHKRLINLHNIAPSFKYKAAMNHIEMLEGNLPNLVDLVPIFPFFSRYWDRLEELKTKVPGRFSWYVCCWPAFPNTSIASPLVESRLIPLLTYYMGLDGFLRWNYTVWPDEPRRRLSFRTPSWPSGETNFVYPGNHGGPLLSLRYKNFFKGIQDYQLLVELSKVRDDHETIIEEAFEFILKEKNLSKYHPELKNPPKDLYSLDEADYEKFFLHIVEAIEDSKIF